MVIQESYFIQWTQAEGGRCLSFHYFCYGRLCVDSTVQKVKILIGPYFFGKSPIGFFDGVATYVNSGIGIVIKHSTSHCHRGDMAIGTGSNTRAELLALWGLMFLSHYLNLQDVIIAGDSKVVVDWFNGKAILNVLILQAWKQRIEDLRSMFTSIKAFHIHPAYNSQADKLSKTGLNSEFGVLFVDEFEEESRISSRSLTLF